VASKVSIELHPLVDPLLGDLRGDDEFGAGGERRVRAVHEGLVGEPARPEPGVVVVERGEHPDVRTGRAQRVRKLRGPLDEPAAGQVASVVAGDLADLVIGQPVRRAGADHLRGPAVPAADVPGQVADAPTGAGRHRCAQVGCLELGGEQLGLVDDLGAVAVELHDFLSARSGPQSRPAHDKDGAGTPNLSMRAC